MTSKLFLINGFKMLKSNLAKDNLTAFKIKAYNTAIKAIENHDGNIQDVADIKGLSKKMQEKAAEIMSNPALQEDIKDNAEKQKASELFTNIMGIGDVKAKELVNTHKIMNIAQLSANQHLLNDKQKGLKHYDDFLERIPRKEMDRHNSFLETHLNSLNLQYCVVGSYRRGAANSGDIDVLITSNDNDNTDILKTVVSLLEKQKYLSDTFAFGKEKYLGTAKLPRFKHYRRIDLLYINKNKYPFALLYFTGSQAFNIKMRQIALDKGLSLSEHGFKYVEGGEFVKEVFECELDIFKYIGMDYVEPIDRK